MTCAQVLSRISAYHDGELIACEREPIDAHVRSCPKCAAHLADLDRIGGMLRSCGPDEAPDGLWERIEVSARFRAPAWRRARGWSTRAAAVAAGFVLYWFGYGALTSDWAPDATSRQAKAIPVEPVLREVGLALAGNLAFSDRPGLFRHLPESRMLAEFLEETNP